jgi:hypothetical protein
MNRECLTQRKSYSGLQKSEGHAPLLCVGTDEGKKLQILS